MSDYADTGLLCSLYSPDTHTARAAVWLERQTLPLPIAWLHQRELRTARCLRVFRGEITRAQR